MEEKTIIIGDMKYLEKLKKSYKTLFIIEGILLILAFFAAQLEGKAPEVIYMGPGVAFMVLFIPAIVCLILYFYYSKMELTVTNKRVYGRVAFGRRVDLPLDSISAAGTTVRKGIIVSSSSGKIKFYGISNQEEVHKAITDLLMERQNNPKPTTQIKQEIQQSNADELKKFKELLDSGIITQEEFDAKKKQLLGL